MTKKKRLTAEEKLIRDAERAERRKVYREEKRKLLIKEAKNYSWLALIQSEDPNWYKFFGHSAVIYTQYVCKTLHITSSQLRPDGDGDPRSPEGVAIIRDRERLIQNLKRMNIKLVRETEWLTVFALPKAMTPGDYKQLEQANETRLIAANRLILPKEIFPKMSQEIRMMVREVYTRIRILPPVERRLAGDRMLTLCQEIQTGFLLVAMGEREAAEEFPRMLSLLRELSAVATILMDLGIVDGEKAYMLAVRITDVEKRIGSAMKRKEKEGGRMAAKTAAQGISDGEKE